MVTKIEQVQGDDVLRTEYLAAGEFKEVESLRVTFGEKSGRYTITNKDDFITAVEESIPMGEGKINQLGNLFIIGEGEESPLLPFIDPATPEVTDVFLRISHKEGDPEPVEQK